MRVAIIYTESETTPPGQHWLHRSGACADIPAEVRDASERGQLADVHLIGNALAERGYECLMYAAHDAAALCAFLARERPDAIFNCCEWLSGRADLEMAVAALYDLFGIPYTGSPALTLGLSLDKGLTKRLLQAHGVPTPPWAVVRRRRERARARRLRFPLIVKPLREDASLGVDASAVVADDAALARRLDFLFAEFSQPALVEEYIDGREFHVSLLATSPSQIMALPVSEILFHGCAPGTPRIVTYEAKWVEESAAYWTTTGHSPGALDPALEARVVRTALAAARVTGVRDYGRVDLRVRTGDNAVFVLEVNPNPDLNDEAGFLRSAHASGRTFGGTVVEILERCLERSGLAGSDLPRRVAAAR